MKASVPKPDWFAEADYAFVARLDARGWLNALCRANAKLDPSWPAKREEWRDVFGPEIDNMYPAYIPPPAVRLIEGPITLHPFELPALLINLSAPDGVIKQGFEKALRAAREKHRSLVKKRGRPALNAAFKAQFSTWCRYKILQLADLLAWKACENIDVSDAELGRWLEFDKKETEQAKAVLFKALHSIPALAAQIAAKHAAEDQRES
jgi:hypothetical protein